MKRLFVAGVSAGLLTFGSLGAGAADAATTPGNYQISQTTNQYGTTSYSTRSADQRAERRTERRAARRAARQAEREREANQPPTTQQTRPTAPAGHPSVLSRTEPRLPGAPALAQVDADLAASTGNTVCALHFSTWNCVAPDGSIFNRAQPGFNDPGAPDVRDLHPDSIFLGRVFQSPAPDPEPEPEPVDLLDGSGVLTVADGERAAAENRNVCRSNGASFHCVRHDGSLFTVVNTFSEPGYPPAGSIVLR